MICLKFFSEVERCDENLNSAAHLNTIKSQQSDLDVNVLHDVLCKGAMSSPLVQGKEKAVINSNFATNFPLKHQQKDFRLALKLSEDVKQPIPTIAAANELYKTAMARDHGDADMCDVSEALKN